MKINKQQQKEIDALAKLSDDSIDYSDIPEDINNEIKYIRMDNKQFNKFINNSLPLNEFVNLLSKTMNEMVLVNLRLDKEVVDFFKEHSKHYQVKINEALLMLVHKYKEHKH